MNVTMLRILKMSEGIPSSNRRRLLCGETDDCQVKPTESFGVGFGRDKFH